MFVRSVVFATLLAALSLLGVPASVTAEAAIPSRPAFGPDEGAVFVGTNHNNMSDPTQPANQIAMYRRAADGRLTLIGYFDTGGQGSGPGQRFAGDGLGSGNSVRLSRVAAWQIGDSGRLTKLGEFAGLPQTVNGDQPPFDFSALGSPAGIEVI